MSIDGLGASREYREIPVRGRKMTLSVGRGRHRKHGRASHHHHDKMLIK